MSGLLAKRFFPIQHHYCNVLSLMNFYFYEFLRKTCLENAMWGCSNKSNNFWCFDLIKGVGVNTKEVVMVSSAQCPVSYRIWFCCVGRKTVGKRKLSFQDIRCFFQSSNKKALNESIPVCSTHLPDNKNQASENTIKRCNQWFVSFL